MSPWLVPLHCPYFPVWAWRKWPEGWGEGELPSMLLWLQPMLLRGRVMKTYPNPCQRLTRNIWHLTYNNKQELKVKSHATQAFGKRICLCNQLLSGCKGTVCNSGTVSELSGKYSVAYCNCLWTWKATIGSVYLYFHTQMPFSTQLPFRWWNGECTAWTPLTTFFACVHVDTNYYTNTLVPHVVSLLVGNCHYSVRQSVLPSALM